MAKKQYDKALRQEVLERFAGNAPNVTKLLRGLQGLEAEMRNRKRQNYTAEEDRIFQEDRLAAIQLDYFGANQVEKERVQAALDKLGQKWERKNKVDPAAALLEQQRWAAEFSLSTDGELSEMADRYVKRLGFDMDPDEVLALAVEMQRRPDLSGDASILKKSMTEYQYRKPWRNSPEGQALLEEAKLYDVPYGEYAVLAEDESGAAVMGGFDIEQMLDGE